MKRTKIIKILILLLLVSILLGAATSIFENSFTPKLSGTSVSVLPSNVIWKKTYGSLGDDDRAFNTVTAGDGYLVVGSAEPNKSNVTLGWALRLDGDGNILWNRTYLEGSGSELRVAVKL